MKFLIDAHLPPSLRAMVALLILRTTLALGSGDVPPDVPLIEKTCLAMANKLAPRPKNEGAVIILPDETRFQYGKLFDEATMALVNFYPRPPNDGTFDYPPCYLSLLEWKDEAWHFRQFLGSASSLDIHRRNDLKLKIVQGWCRTARNEGEQSSWKWRSTNRKLVPTGLDDWGAFSIKGNYICYKRGTERLAHWDTHWIYRYADGVRGKLVACFHEDDEGRWTVSFRAKPDDKELTHWVFAPSLEAPSFISLRLAAEEDTISGEQIAELRLPHGEELGQGFCFTWLTGLSTKLLDDEWLEKVPTARIKVRPKIEVTGAADVIARFQWPKNP